MPPHEARVCVTGASGFIAAHCVQRLLERGFQVRGTVRDATKLDKYGYLLQLPGAAERLELVTAELQTPGSYDAAVDGCTYVLHTASPYVVNVDDPKRDLVDPAVSGTTNVLDSCNKSDGVRRLVLTSSMAAISDEPMADHVFTEEDWNERSSLKRNPYYYSKTRAERAAWAYVRERAPQFDLVALNPYMVIGPSLGPGLNQSNQMFRDFLTGVYPGVMNLDWGFVDVRDVATAHLAAMENPSASGRYILAGDATTTMSEVIALLKESGFDRGYALPKVDLSCALGDFAMKVASYTQPKGVGSYLRTHLGKTMRYDNRRAKRGLGIDFRDTRQSILDAVASLIDHGHVAPPQRPPIDT